MTRTLNAHLTQLVNDEALNARLVRIIHAHLTGAPVAHPLSPIAGTNTPFRDMPKPHPAQGEALLCDGAMVASVTIEGRPALVFQFSNGPRTLQPIVLTRFAGLGELVSEAEQSAMAHDGMTVDDVPEPEPAPKVYCPGCGLQLHGERAEIGWCKGCGQGALG